jgi:RNA-directed DNA polymerase
MALRLQHVASCADALDMTEDELRNLSTRAKDLYLIPRKKAKPSGGFRTIVPPNRQLMGLQRKIYKRILNASGISEINYGGVSGRDNVLAAKQHVGQDCVAVVDMRACFRSITNKMVDKALRALGCSPDVSHVLTPLMTREGHLPEGSPTSMALANRVFPDIDRVLTRLAAQGLKCTRFVDDIVISGNRSAVVAAVESIIEAVHEAGLKISYKESRHSTGASSSACNEPARQPAGIRADHVQARKC